MSSQPALVENDPQQINNSKSNSIAEATPSAPPANINSKSEKPELESDYSVWLVGNAVIFNVVLLILFAIGFYYTTVSTNMREVSANWAKYRCDPSIMPFASLYGYNTAENFNYCLGGIFNTFSADSTSSKSSSKNLP